MLPNVEPGHWRLLRLKQFVPCDACQGTVAMATIDGTEELFQCDQAWHPPLQAAVYLLVVVVVMVMDSKLWL